MNENRADAHLINQAANCIARMATAHNVPTLQIIERLMSESEGVVVEITDGGTWNIRNARMGKIPDGTYRLTRIEDPTTATPLQSEGDSES